jgi:hypothetical protein
MLHQHLVRCLDSLELHLSSCLGCHVRVLVRVELQVSTDTQG